MVRRTKKKTTVKKTKKPAVRRKKTVSRKRKPAAKKTANVNQKAQWIAYHELQTQVDRAWAKLQSDVKKKASPQILVKDKNELLLLLGECNYMARECMRMAAKGRND